MSLRIKRAWYTGRLSITVSPHRIICGIKPATPPLNSILKMTLVIPATKLKRFSSANVDMMVTIRDTFPNSIISCWYLFKTPSSATLAVMTKVVSDSPSCLVRLSIKAKRYEVADRISHVRSRFHHALNESPHHTASSML